MKKIVGTGTIGYPEKRNFADLPFEKYRIEKKQNLHKIPAYLYYKLTGNTHDYYWNSFRDFDLNRVDLFHFFNALSYGQKPWICTFETSIPRWNGIHTQRGLELIAGDACKKLIAISECAANIQKHVIEDCSPDLSEPIIKKMMVLHPPQHCPPPGEIKKDLSGKIVFTLVGNKFFLKGGKELLSAFDRLYKNGHRNWEFNIISNMDIGDHASKSTQSDLDFAEKIIARYPQNIRHSLPLPNKEVLAIFRRSHVGLLPTYADTYGYSVLEAQAFGCPVISTNIRALPEINSDQKGWLIEVDKDEFGYARLDTEGQIKHFSKQLEEQLYRTISDILLNPEDIPLKGRKSYEDLKGSVDRNTATLEQLYDEISSS